MLGTGISSGHASNTQFFDVQQWRPDPHRGLWRFRAGDVQLHPDYNVGSAAQFSENTFYTNKGFSSYNGLLVSLQKNLSHGLQFDVNYTWAHSIDNSSFFANSEGDTGIGGIGLVCDVAHPRMCRANSDFDVTHYITGDELYQLPFGKGREFMANSSAENMLVGGWDISGVTECHTGTAWGTNSKAFVASYSNNAPGILVGQAAAVATNVTKLSGRRR